MTHLSIFSPIVPKFLCSLTMIARPQGTTGSQPRCGMSVLQNQHVSTATRATMFVATCGAGCGAGRGAGCGAVCGAVCGAGCDARCGAGCGAGRGAGRVAGCGS